MSVPATSDLTTLRAAYASGATTPEEVAREAMRRAEDTSRHPHVWIERLDPERVMAFVRALPAEPGLPFSFYHAQLVLFTLLSCGVALPLLLAIRLPARVRD